MKLSIVATLYQSESHINEFYDRASAAAQKIAGKDYEIVFVNDGSPDDSLEIALALTKNDPKVVVVDLSRNFGHHKAMMAGLSQSKGDLVFLIDSDLEEDPGWLLRFHDQLITLQKDVIFGVQSKRKGGVLERISGGIYYRLFRMLTQVEQVDNFVTARLMTRRYVDALLLYKESEINIGGLWAVTGFNQSPVRVEKKSSSKTSYSFRGKIGHFVNAITSFSSAPLVLTFYTGLGISTFSAIYVLHLIFQYFFAARPIDGYTSLIASIWLLSGLIILFLGVQGIYLSKIFMEVKNRPNVIIRAVHGRDDNE